MPNLKSEKEKQFYQGIGLIKRNEIAEVGYNEQDAIFLWNKP